jgi:hypothetical protein
MQSIAKMHNSRDAAVKARQDVRQGLGVVTDIVSNNVDFAVSAGQVHRGEQLMRPLRGTHDMRLDAQQSVEDLVGHVAVGRTKSRVYAMFGPARADNDATTEALVTMFV